jgi:organic hydroperoxide reductase OsmC/OhrA
MSLSGQRGGSSEESIPEDLLAGAHSASLAMAIGVEIDIDRKLERSTRRVVDTDM